MSGQSERALETPKADPETAGVSSEQFTREAARLARLQASAIALQDATGYLRNMYVVSTAAFVTALTRVLQGDAAAAAAFKEIAGGLETATAQFEKVAALSRDLTADS